MLVVRSPAGEPHSLRFGVHMQRDHLRPLERVVLRLVDSGTPVADIAWRLRRSPGHVSRIVELIDVPRERPSSAASTERLRPVERCIIRARDKGADSQEIASRLRRSPAYVERVTEYAAYKMDRGHTR